MPLVDAPACRILLKSETLPLSFRMTHFSFPVLDESKSMKKEGKDFCFPFPFNLRDPLNNMPQILNFLNVLQLPDHYEMLMFLRDYNNKTFLLK